MHTYILRVHSVICRNFCVFCNQRLRSYKCRKITDISRRKSILRKMIAAYMSRKRHLMKKCRENYPCNKYNGKHNITICEGPRK